jgi:hypothetical protein
MKIPGKPINPPENTGKQHIEMMMSHYYPGVTIRWNGNNPTLVIPDNLVSKKDEIIQTAEACWRVKNGKVDFQHG